MKKNNHRVGHRTRRTPDRDTIGKGAACLCINIFMTTQERSPFYRLCSDKEDAAEAAMHQSTAEGAGCLPNRIM